MRDFGRVVLPLEVPWLIDQVLWVFAKGVEECLGCELLRGRAQPVERELLLWAGGLYPASA